MAGFGLHDAWVAFLKRRAEAAHPGFEKEVAAWFGKMPKHFREGSWAWFPTLVLGGLCAAVVATAPTALASFQPVPAAPELLLFRVAGFVFGAGVLARMVCTTGAWPWISWTMLGWTVATLRYLAGISGLTGLQRALTFPAMVANCATVLIWYCALVPGIYFMSPKGKRLQAVKGWCCSWFLFTVHGINLPLSVLDWYMQPFRLEFFDLWMGMAYAMLYMVFYLSVLDVLGIHLYIVICPRKWWGGLIFLNMIALGVGFFAFFNTWEASMSGSVAGTGLSQIFALS